MIYLAHNLRNRLFCQICNCMNCSKFHFLIYSSCRSIQRSSEYIRETDHIVDLIRIIRAACTHKYVRTRVHSILVADLRHRVSKGKDNRILCHRANHILAQDITF